MGVADGLPVGMGLAVTQQFLGCEPVVEFDAFKAAAVDPQVIG